MFADMIEMLLVFVEEQVVGQEDDPVLCPVLPLLLPCFEQLGPIQPALTLNCLFYLYFLNLRKIVSMIYKVIFVKIQFLSLKIKQMKNIL